jgi:hypothetical protein
VIADLSVHHLEGFILEEGHTTQRLASDYGYDMLMFTHDPQGYVEPGMVHFQLKAAETLQVVQSDYVFDLDVRDYNLWMREDTPVILVLFEASRKRAYWVHVQGYFGEEVARRPRKGTKTVRVRVPIRQVVNRAAIRSIRDLKRTASLRGKGEGS